MEQTKTILKKTWVVAALACVCCLLWGSAIPLIKTGYRLMQMDSADTASQIVFAGVRFALAGILVLIFASLRERKVLLPDRTVLKYAVPVCMAQTVCQYFFFYIGVAHTSGVKGAIITGLGNFIAILLSCLVFHKEKMTGRKMLGCILGFAGVVVINLMGNSLDAGFRIIFYLAMVSAVAYTLWSVLLAWNDVSRVAIFGFVNPLFSVILSALVLGEVHQAFNMGSLIALFLVCVGIYVVNQKKSS